MSGESLTAMGFDILLSFFILLIPERRVSKFSCSCNFLSPTVFGEDILIVI